MPYIKISKRWSEKAKLYKKHAEDFYYEAAEARYRSLKEIIKICPYNFSEKAAQEMFIFESTGRGNLNSDIFNGSINGYLIGKKWYDVWLSQDHSNDFDLPDELYRL